MLRVALLVMKFDANEASDVRIRISAVCGQIKAPPIAPRAQLLTYTTNYNDYVRLN